MRSYSRLEALVNSVPYVAMMLLGSAVIALGFKLSRAAWIGTASYLAYGVFGTLWVMLFVCPYCAHYGSRSCHSGFGAVSGMLVKRGDAALFVRQFKRHIPVVVPLWFAPFVAGTVALVRGFSWPVLGLLAAFSLDSFVVLPLVSRHQGCRDCPQKDSCPWMNM